MGRQFTIANALAAIWLIVAVFLMLRYFVKYQEMRRIFQKYSTEANEQCQSVLSRITQEKRLKENSGISESGDYYSLCGRCIPVEYLSSGLRLFGRRIILCFAPWMYTFHKWRSVHKMADAALSLSLLVESTGLQNAGYIGKNLEIGVILLWPKNSVRKSS